MVLSECSKNAVMGFYPASVAKEILRSFGLDEVSDDIIDKITRFKIGRLLLASSWVNELKICLTAARRNVEGGRNLREKHWADPYSNTVK